MHFSLCLEDSLPNPISYLIPIHPCRCQLKCFSRKACVKVLFSTVSYSLIRLNRPYNLISNHMCVVLVFRFVFSTRLSSEDKGCGCFVHNCGAPHMKELLLPKGTKHFTEVKQHCSDNRKPIRNSWGNWGTKDCLPRWLPWRSLPWPHSA